MADRLKVNLDWTLKVRTKVDFPANKVARLDKEKMKKRLESWFEASYGLRQKPDDTILCDENYEITVDKLEYEEVMMNNRNERIDREAEPEWPYPCWRVELKEDEDND